MKITYPNMGNLHIAIKTILEKLGFDLVEPPKISKTTAKLGTKLAPEGACYPFKLVLGNVMEALEEGANTAIMLGGNGPCRFGYFGSLMDEILRDSGYECNTLILEGQEIFGQVNSLREAAGAGWIDVLGALRLGWKKMALIDRIEEASHKARPIERKPGMATEVLNQSMHLVDKIKREEEIYHVEKMLLDKLNEIVRPAKMPLLRVGLVGDIYMLIEPYANHRIEEFLGGLGVEVHRSIFVSHWVKTHVGQLMVQLHKRNLLSDALPYLQDFVGGHGLDTIANIVRYHNQGYDGIIHILPMTCMPEIVAQSITPKVNRDLGIPVMTLVLDEHSGTAGMQTRIEAFMDILLRRKSLAVT